MVRVLGQPHLSQLTGVGVPLVDHLRWYRCLDQGLALVAGPLATDVALDGELAGDIIQLLTDVLANTLELAAALALSIVRFVVDFRICPVFDVGESLSLGQSKLRNKLLNFTLSLTE